MKKRFLFLAVALTFMSGCAKSEENYKGEKFLLEGEVNINSPVNLTAEEFDAKMENKDSFVLLLHSTTCSSCRSFKTNVLNPFIENTQAKIYQLEQRDASSSQYQKKLNVRVTPTLYVIIDGSIKSKQEYDSKQDAFKSKEGLEKFLKKYSYMPIKLTISETDLDQKIVAKEKMLVYFGWYLCGDCAKLNTRVLSKYLIEKMKGKILYYVEVNDYINIGSPDSEGYEERRAAWNAFCEKYHFNENWHNVPMLQYYDENGAVADWFCYYNDSKDENGVITKSYLEELIGQTLTEEEHLQAYDTAVTSWLDQQLAKL